MPDASRGPIHLLLACGPGGTGASAFLERAAEAARAGRAVRAILTGDGLAWIGDPRLAPVSVSVCSRSARERALAPESAPGAAWSSLVAWSRDLPDDACVWAALP